MAFNALLTLPITVAAGGGLSTTVGALISPASIPAGKIRKLRYVHNGTNAFSNAATITLTGAITGQNILAATVTTGATDQEWAPQNPGVLSTTGVAPSTVTVPYVDVPIGGEDIKIVIAAAGASTQCTLYLWIGD